MSDVLPLHVVDRGSGPPVVFVHGWLNDATVWDPLIDDLSADARCVALDLPGHGRSPAPGPGEYGRDRVLSAISQTLDALSIETAVLVGHSLGGYLALAFAIEAPERVDGLGLIAAGPGFRNPTSRDAWNESVLGIAATRDLPDGMHEISLHVDSYVIDHLGLITCPVAVVVGERDTRFLASADVFDDQLNVHARATVTNQGHMVHVKAPDQVAAVLRRAFEL